MLLQIFRYDVVSSNRSCREYFVDGVMVFASGLAENMRYME